MLAVIVALVGFTGWYVYHSTKAADKMYYLSASLKQDINFTKKAAVTSPGSSLPVTYDHGVLVPADSQVKAKSLDYYCPSWDGQPGHMTPDFCTVLDPVKVNQ